LTTNQGVRISDNHNSLKAGPRGPTLLEDFVLREKITSFDHERIPERVVHARGAGAFGTFECTKGMKAITSAGLFGTPGKKTPVFLRFSTVAGSRGSADTARDVRGFAVKFYTDEGNFDLVGNNIPIFFIHDAMKFPDLVHAAKPEPHNEIPQAQTAHDTFWDFVSLMPESTHMLFWIMSDRAIPRSYRMMEGFGVHTFRFVNAEGKGTFVKFHWKPRLGIHGITWEESLNLAGQDPDFHRRDLWENIAKGAFPEWDLGVQLIPESDELKFDFDLLDPTKIVPEELVPVEIIGKLTLNRNPDNFFAEVEQVAFHVGNLVPGIDVTNDPLLQGRLFSYQDTQLIRLGGPNFHQLPINRPLADVNNHQRDGFSQHAVPKGRVAYEPNSLGGGCPFHSPEKMKSFVHFTERVDAHKVRARSTSFGDHFSQAKLFFESQTPTEQNHILEAFSFELSKVETKAVRQRMVDTLAQVDRKLADAVGAKVGVKVSAKLEVQPNPSDPENNVVPTNRTMVTALEDEPSSTKKTKTPKTSDALSMVKTARPDLRTRKIAVLVGKGVDGAALTAFVSAVEREGAACELVGTDLGPVPGTSLEVMKTFDNTTALHFDAVWIADGARELGKSGPVRRFVLQAYKHCKTVGGAGSGSEICEKAIQSQAEFVGGKETAAFAGVVLAKAGKAPAAAFIQTAKTHRHWEREALTQNMAT
jgi:catalase